MIKSKKESKREKRDWEIIESDRVDMMAQANELVLTMNLKAFAASQSSIPSPPLTPHETSAYNKALGFLSSQFEKGYTGTSHHMTSMESENETDIEHNVPPIKGGKPDQET